MIVHRVGIALVGNPNAGKTTLFNALTGLRAQTANFPGTTVEHRVGRLRFGLHRAELVDLPGLYSLSAETPDERIARDAVLGRLPGQPAPDAVLLVLDATNLQRNLFLASQVLELQLPTLVALNMSDLAKQMAIHIDHLALAKQLGCTVVPVSARNGDGVDLLRDELEKLLDSPGLLPQPVLPPPCGANCGGCMFQARHNWAESLTEACAQHPPRTQLENDVTARLDRVLTHPLGGVAAFLVMMLGLFYLIFSLAAVPMSLIENVFGALSQGATSVLPEGLWSSFVSNGVIAGLGGVLVFLPQICILFFLLSLLEDSGYLARAAFVMERIMRTVGLPGKAFVPLLSTHACAIPAIMSTRVIENWRDRLLTILVLPLATCSARIPVYVMLIALLLPGRPFLAASVFAGCYLLGLIAVFGAALALKRSVLRGETEPLVIELPAYKWPSLKNTLIVTLERARLFVFKAGTVILAISLVMWALASFPRSAPPPEAVALQARAETERSLGQTQEADDLSAQADNLTARYALTHSCAGRLGKLIEPAIRPLGYDWQIGIGLISSFAAREVFVSTMAVVFGVGEGAAEESTRVSELVRQAKREDGTLVFTPAVCVSLLVFYVLAMQCMATLAVVRRETGSWKWPILQFGYMTVLAYLSALAAYHLALWVGV